MNNDSDLHKSTRGLGMCESSVSSDRTTGYAAVWYVLLYDTLSDAVVQHEYLST